MFKSVALRLSLTLILACGLSACRESEQGRPTEFTPGVYKGKPDQKLSEDTRKALRERSRHQGRN